MTSGRPTRPDRRELALVVNPSAGGGRAGGAVERVVTRLRAGHTIVRVISGATAEETAQRVAAEVASGTPTLVALGGDGLVNLTLQASAGTDTILGVIPMGSGNDIGRAIGLKPNDAMAAVDVVLAGRARRIDLGRASQRWFAGVLSAGFDSAVNQRANTLRWPRGRARYNVAIAAELAAFDPLPYVLDLDGRQLETEALVVAVGNGPTYGGGMRVCPAARLDDGLFDIMVLRPVSTATFVRLFPRVYSGTHVNHSAVEVHRARRVSVSAPAGTAYADGELVASLPVTCEVVPGAARVLVP